MPDDQGPNPDTSYVGRPLPEAAQALLRPARAPDQRTDDAL